MDDLLQIFFAEAEDLTEALNKDVGALRVLRHRGSERREILARIFRHAHTLKGSSAALGFADISRLAHEFESLLDAARTGRLDIDDAALDLFEQTAQALATALDCAARHEPLPASDEIIARLRALATPRSAADDPLTALPPDLAQMLNEYEQHRLREAAREGATPYVVSVAFDLADFDEKFRALREALSERGEVIATVPEAEASSPEKIHFRILYASASDRQTIEETTTKFAARLMAARAQTADEKTTAAERQPAEDVPPRALATTVSPPAPSPSSLVRVSLEELDDMVFSFHALFTETMTTLDKALRGVEGDVETELRAARLRRHFLELEERLVELRMVPIAQTLERAARSARATARTAQKEVEVEITGGEVRLDKSLADMISDPLLHLVRNAVDHGIEPSEQRRQANKSARGKLTLEAISEGSRIVVRVSDDGRGIDPARVRRTAIERGLIDESDSLTQEQILRLIFRPGFSTAATVSDISGRGVGLDVVERAVEQTGGELRVWSEVGRGTTFEMVLPTTLTLLSSLVVRSMGHRYCVPSNQIVETGVIRATEIERLGEMRVVRWRGAVLPFVHLRELLAQPPAENGSERISIIVSRLRGQQKSPQAAEARRVAIAVDEWEGHSEVLVRSLGRHASHWRGISGATELSDGTVALILDLPRLLEIERR